MIEHDHGPACRGFVAIRHRHERVYLQTIGLVRGDIALIVATWIEYLFNCNVAAGIVAGAHCFNREGM